MDEPAELIFWDAETENLYPVLFQCFAVIVCGFIAGYLGVVSPSESKSIATFAGTFALPSLIFLSLARLDFSIVNWTFLLAILLAKAIVFSAVVTVTLLVSKPLNLARAGIFAIFCTMSNNFALGYPIINAIYEKTHPEYALYLYLMAPISLAILNPVAFVLMEITKQKNTAQAITNEEERKINLSKKKLLKQIAKGIGCNPVLAMTLLGILGNILFKHNLSIYIEGLLQMFGKSFSASALFLLGLRMVGQMHRLRGQALLLPCVLVIVKLIVLPVVMREFVSTFKPGYNDTDTSSLSTYAFFCGTIPTAPAVFVFSNLYQLEIDCIASSMVLCTLLSAPIMYLSAQVISMVKEYDEQLMKFRFDLSMVALVAGLWVIIVFIATKKYKRKPHSLTTCLLTTQILLAASVIWGGLLEKDSPFWQVLMQKAIRMFAMYSCLMWTSVLSIGMLMLENEDPCCMMPLWPVFGFVAWGAPAVIVGVLIIIKAHADELDVRVEAIRLCLLVFCFTVTTGCIIVYIRFGRRSTQLASLSDDLSGESPVGETASLVINAETVSNALSITGCCYERTATPSTSTNDPTCMDELNCNEEHFDTIRDCAFPESQKHRCMEQDICQYLTELERAASQLVNQPSQLLRHTVLIIVYSLSMFIGITYTAWRVLKEDETGTLVEIEFFDVAATYGQTLLMFILFGLDPEETLGPIVRLFKNKLHGTDSVVLPSVEELSFETKHVCDHFITHHLDRCKEAIAKDTRWRMRTYRGVFRGSCLVRWLLSCGLAKDEHEAVVYGRHLLDGRLIAHINHQHHFTNTPLLYTFK